MADHDDLYAKAIELFDAGRQTDATSLMQRYVELYPRQPRGLSALGKFALKRGAQRDAYYYRDELKRNFPQSKALLTLETAIHEYEQRLRSARAMPSGSTPVSPPQEAPRPALHPTYHGPPGIIRNARAGPVPDETFYKPPQVADPPSRWLEAMVARRPEHVSENIGTQLNARKSLKLRVTLVAPANGLPRSYRTVKPFEFELRGREQLGVDPAEGDWIAFPPPDSWHQATGPEMVRNLTTGGQIRFEDRPGPVPRNTAQQWRWQKIGFYLRLFAAIAIVLGFCTWLLWSNVVVPRQILAVPDVQGLDQGAASTALSDAGFTTVRSRIVKDESLPSGTVVGSDPSAGAQVERRTPITLLIGDRIGPPGSLVTVPDVSGLTEFDAMNRLLNAGIWNFEKRGSTSGNIVDHTEPGPGSQVKPTANGDRGDLVLIYMSE